MLPSLSPAQQRAYERLHQCTRPGRIASLHGRRGTGKSTILRRLASELGGVRLGARDFMAALDTRHPLAVEESLHDLLTRTLGEHELVLVDDLDAIVNVICCGHAYPRTGLVQAPLTAIAAHVGETGTRLICSADHLQLMVPWDSEQMTSIAQFTAEDYAHLCREFLGDAASALDVERIHRFARRLSASALRATCEALADQGRIDTEAFLEHLRAYHVAANVDLQEVQAVDLHDLKGLDDVLEALEANVVLPLENAALAEELQLKPKRGVLLAGPPGTGKTTVGRALAHRLKSKFFLVDGTVISGTSSFFHQIQRIFDAAKRNAPAIIFIDDSDVLFEGGGETGFYRYLLTILDGIESESAGRICLMMTAMDVGNLPPALVRSGRIELWLETRLPDEAARLSILEDRCAVLPASVGALDLAQLAAASEGLSGADLRRVVEDGKVLLAFDRARGRPLQPSTAYFLRAIGTVRGNKVRYAEAEARARTKHPSRPPMFDVMEAFAVSEGLDAMPGAMMSVSRQIEVIDERMMD